MENPPFCSYTIISFLPACACLIYPHELKSIGSSQYLWSFPAFTSISGHRVLCYLNHAFPMPIRIFSGDRITFCHSTPYCSILFDCDVLNKNITLLLNTHTHTHIGKGCSRHHNLLSFCSTFLWLTFPCYGPRLTAMLMTCVIEICLDLEV